MRPLTRSTIGLVTIGCIAMVRHNSVCENETNTKRLYGVNGAMGPFKDAFHDYVVNGRREAVSKTSSGTKAAAYYPFTIALADRRKYGCG